MRQILIFLLAAGLVLGVGCGSTSECKLAHERQGAVYPNGEERAVLDEYRELSDLRKKKLQELNAELEKTNKDYGKLVADYKVWESWGSVQGDYDRVPREKADKQKVEYGSACSRCGEKVKELRTAINMWEGRASAKQIFLYAPDLKEEEEKKKVQKPQDPPPAPTGREPPPLLKTGD